MSVRWTGPVAGGFKAVRGLCARLVLATIVVTAAVVAATA